MADLADNAFDIQVNEDELDAVIEVVEQVGFGVTAVPDGTGWYEIHYVTKWEEREPDFKAIRAAAPSVVFDWD